MYQKNFVRPGDYAVEVNEVEDQEREEEMRRETMRQLLSDDNFDAYEVRRRYRMCLEQTKLTYFLAVTVCQPVGAPDPEPDMPLWLTNENAATEEVERRLRAYVDQHYTYIAETAVKFAAKRPNVVPDRKNMDVQPDDVEIDDLTDSIDFEGLRQRFRHEIDSARKAARDRLGR